MKGISLDIEVIYANPDGAHNLGSGAITTPEPPRVLLDAARILHQRNNRGKRKFLSTIIIFRLEQISV